MHTIVFEDGAVPALGPLVALRPACDLSIGSMTLAEGLSVFGEIIRVLRPPLARHLAAVRGRRVPFWGGRDATPVPHADSRHGDSRHGVSRHGAILLVVNARLVPSRHALATLRSLVEAGREGIVRDERTVLAAVLKVGADPSAATEIAVRLEAATDPAGFIESLAAEPLAVPQDGRLEPLESPVDLLDAHEREIETTLAMRIDSGRYRRHGESLFVAEGAEIAEAIAVRGGPVVVEPGATIGPFVCLDGPAWIGPRTRVHPHAWLRPGTAAGHDCRLGGEIEATVLEPFSSKPHEGFVGHSHVGSWVNLAAGTVTSNLKATYGTVRLRDADGRVIETGRQFVGGFIGDLTRTAVHTSIGCGTLIGPAAVVGGNVSGCVPPFTMTLQGTETTSGSDQAATVLERMMARRGIAICEADRRLITDLEASCGAASSGYSKP